MKDPVLTSENIIREKEIVEDILQGNKESFALLVRENNQLLYRTGMTYLKDHSEVEDVMQITYLKAFENIKKFNSQSSFRTWLVRIMINECLMLLRSRKRKKEKNFPGLHSLIELEVPDTTAAEPGTEISELKNLLEATILKLPDDYRLVFMLREIEEMGTREVAEALEISEENVKVRLHRAKKILKALLLSQLPKEIFPYHKQFCEPLTKKVMASI